MIAAGKAASRGGRVLVLEKNRRPGKKLSITGGSRCNITNAEFDTHRLVGRFGHDGKKLYSVLSGFGPAQVMEFFESRGLSLKVEAEQRAFPISDRAEDVVAVLEEFCRSEGATILANQTVRFVQSESGFFEIQTAKGAAYRSRSLLVATGGYAHPETGSTGDGFDWLKNFGHEVREPDPILVPIRVRESWCKKLMGLSFPDIGLRAIDTAGRTWPLPANRGKLLFTHFGLSGPLVLNASGALQEAADELDSKGAGDRLAIDLDFFPGTDGGSLERDLLARCAERPKKQLLGALGDLVPPRLLEQVCTAALVDARAPASSLTKAARKQLVKGLKHFRLHFAGRLGVEKAIVSRGGVSLDEVDFKTMESKKKQHLYLAGDVLDFDRPSGGFSLQICWSTGWRVGESVPIHESVSVHRDSR